MEIRKTDIDGQELLSEIRNRIRSKLNVREQLNAVPESDGQVAGPDFSVLRQMARLLQDSCVTLGRPPLQPATVRGRVGAVLVRVVQRMLFWYTPQITGFQSLVAGAAQEQLKQTERLAAALACSEAGRAELLKNVNGFQQKLEEVRTDAIRNHQALELQMTTARSAMAEAQSERVTEIRELREEVGSLQQQLEMARAAAIRHGQAMELQVAAAQSAASDIEHLCGLVAGSAERLRDSEQTIAWLKASCMAQERRISVMLEEIRKGVRGSPALESTALDREKQHQTDAWYVSFENQFRGPREEIKSNLAFYLPALKEAGVGNHAMPVLDIGCGRGEWIELLRDEGLAAFGVDSNRAMVAYCEERGLDVAESDGVGHLRELQAESLGAVTAFHVVEHLAFTTLVDLLDETVRVLKPGGIAIFETPNPSNVLVGTHNFYLDPTHRNPLPSMLMKYLAEARGLSRVEVAPLHPCPDGTRVPEDGSEIVRRFNGCFYGPQDYAVIGYKG